MPRAGQTHRRDCKLYAGPRSWGQGVVSPQPFPSRGAPKPQLPSTVARAKPGPQDLPGPGPFTWYPGEVGLHSAAARPRQGIPCPGPRGIPAPLGLHPAHSPPAHGQKRSRPTPRGREGAPGAPALPLLPTTPCARRPLTSGRTYDTKGWAPWCRRHRRLLLFPLPPPWAPANAQEQRRPLAAATSTGGRGSAHPQGRRCRSAPPASGSTADTARPRPGRPGPLLCAWAQAVGNPPPEYAPLRSRRADLIGG